MDATDNANSLDSFNVVKDLWFDDADVVFCAGKSKFKVYRGLLSAQSRIFRDMFAIPQAYESETEGDVNDTPKRKGTSLTVITLPDDEKDVRRFFLAIFDASVYGPPPPHYSLEITVSVIRLAHKYDVPFLISRATVHLDSLLPLQSHNDILEDIFHVRRAIPETERNGMLGSFLDMLPLAVLADVQWIIPTLLFHLVSDYNIPQIMVHPSFASLASRYQVMIVQFAFKFALECETFNTWLGFLPSEGCWSKKDRCGYVSRSLQAEKRSGPTRIDVTDPHGTGFCSPCQAVGGKHKEQLSERFWNEYPVLCGYESWDMLKEMRTKWVNAK